MDVRTKDYAFLVAFASATFLSIVFMTVILPNLVFNPDPSSYVMDLNEQQLRGREIYKREGCWYCHSQFVRPQDRNEGPVALSGDYEFRPETIARAKKMGVQLVHLLGTERTGPDLSMIGGKMPDAWHKAHHRNPRAFNPGSVMPSFSYLTDEEMDDLVAYLQTLGRRKNDLERKVTNDFKDNHQLAYQTKGPDGASLAYLIEPEVPWEFKDYYEKQYKSVNPIKYENRYIDGARGIFNNKCAHCHGVQGDGNGPRNLALTERPVNFQSSDPNMGYKTWSDIKWFWKISEGAGPGAVMPRWNGVLEPEQIWYLVNYCKYLAHDRTLPNPPRYDPLRDPALGGPTFHFEGDDLITEYPAPVAPLGVPSVEPGLTPNQTPVAPAATGPGNVATATPNAPSQTTAATSPGSAPANATAKPSGGPNGGPPEVPQGHG